MFKIWQIKFPLHIYYNIKEVKANRNFHFTSTIILKKSNILEDSVKGKLVLRKKNSVESILTC